MSLSPADIERWDAGAVRDVSNALAERGASADDVRAGLSKLPLIASWQGSGGDAARASLDGLSAYLSAHGLDMATVSAATREAADEIERLKQTLSAILRDAKHEGFAIDMASGAVTPLKTDLVGDPIYALQQADLEVRIAELLAAAHAADAALAQAITAAGAAPPGDVPDPVAVLTQRVPDDPRQFHEWWETLTPAQKDALYQRDRSIGNRDGMPAVERDYFNRLALADEIGRAEKAQATADALRDQHPDWANGQHIPPPNKPGAIFDHRLKYEAWQRQYDAARAGAKYLPDLQAVAKAADGTDRKLLLLDTKSGEMAHAAIAVGNPDTADHVSVTAPGLNTTVQGSLVGMTEEAYNLQQESLGQLRNNNEFLDSVSTIAWIGYDTPQIKGFEDTGASLDGIWDVSHGQLARVGAQDLAGFYEGLTASHEGAPAQLTAVGHSYGSLTTGLALQEPGGHGVTDAIFYGSPGIEAATPQQLQLPDGHVFTMQTPDDPIRHVYDTPLLHAGAAALPPPLNALAESALRSLQLTGAGQFGPDPATNPNFTRLETGPAVIPDGGSGTLDLGGAQGHSDYPRFGDDGAPLTTTYNIAAVIAGLQDDAIRQK